jgi:hypothetical protein
LSSVLPLNKKSSFIHLTIAEFGWNFICISMLHPHHFAAIERQMIFWGYILHFFIYLVFSCSTYSDQFIINMKILDVVVRVVIRPAFSFLIKDENKLCVLRRTRRSELRTRWLQRCYPINFVKKKK